ncbi:hypothetical protein BJV82DRAFT_582460 [Fennellomyces sp. T-0311]|nr:hypothetical protein BJV82DRAFT_582460 [Fennellomyces sp. T-0311]
MQLTASCLKRIFSHLSRSDCVHAALACRAWSTPALEWVWANFKFVRERDFERVFAIITRRGGARPYGLYVKSLELVHADRDFILSPNILLLVTTACPNLESISITFNNTRPVAPPVIMQNRPVLPPIKRPGDVQPPHPPHPIHSPHHLLPRPNNNSTTTNNHSSQQQPPSQQHRQHNHSLPLAHLAHNCRRLRSIKLTSYSPKTDDSVYEMAKYMKSGTLQSIAFTGCSTLQGSTLCKLALTNPQLKHIEIMGNTPVSDSSLATLAEHCAANLESLSIGNAHHLTDVSVRHVAKRCRNLKQLILFNNPDGNKLREETIMDIVRNCSHLRVLSLSNARVLAQPFFELVVKRVERELVVIERKEALSYVGLQRLCLGGVRRDICRAHAKDNRD